MKKIASLAALAVTLAAGTAAQAQLAFSISPLASFGTNGWLAPTASTRLGTANAARGLAYNPATGDLLLASTGGTTAVAVLNSLTGAETGVLSGIAAVTGGDRALNMIGVSGDGAIYLTNIRAISSAANRFRVYRWASQSAAATTLAVDQNVLTGSRLGDTFDVIGSGVNTRLVAGFGTAAVAGDNGYAFFTTSDGSAFTGASIAPITGVAEGDFRLGVTFLGSETSILGTQGGATALHGRVTTLDTALNTAVLNGTINLGTGSGRLLDYVEFFGRKLLAVADTGTSQVRIFDMANPLAPVALTATGQTTLVGASNTNVNGAGQVKWGAIDGGTAKLYVMNTNNGIQAFTVAVPEPSAVGLLALAAPALARRRRA